MGTTTVKRTSFCTTQETQRQLDDLCIRFGENKSQVITRAANKAFSHLVDVRDIATKPDIQALKIELQSFMLKCITASVVVLGGLQTLLHFYK